MSAGRKLDPLYTVDNFLDYARATHQRVEYIDGHIRAMATESGFHADISGNAYAEVHAQLKGKKCRARAKDSMVRSGPEPTPGRSMAGLYSLPDVVVICGEPEYLDENRDIILNPTAIIEVLSPSTEQFDRGEKFDRFRQWNPTLRDFMLVSQDRVGVELYSRDDDGGWRLRDYRNLADVIEIPSIGCRLLLADVYDRVYTTDNSDDLNV